MSKFRSLVLVLMVLISASACSALDSACEAVMPTVVTTQAQLADVQRAIADVETYDIREQLPEAQRAIFDEAMGKVRHGYAIAVQALAMMQDTCSMPDLRGAIALIVDGWEVVHDILELVGGTGTIGHQIADPILYTEARR